MENTNSIVTCIAIPFNALISREQEVGGNAWSESFCPFSLIFYASRCTGKGENALLES